jgi:type VI secretion system protein ImpJ
MSWYNKVVWSEGLFLRPQLFQQQERYFEHYAHRRAMPLGAFFWGFDHVSLDAEALDLGRLVVADARGVFQDGTPFAAPAHASLPAPLALTTEHLDQIIYLATPIRTPNTDETSFDAKPESLARYQAFEEDLSDSNDIAQGPKLIQISGLRLRLIPQNELAQSWIGLPVGRLAELRADGSARLDPDFIAPVNVYSASAALRTWLSELHGLMRLRADALAARLSASLRGADAAEISEYLILQLLNRHEPVFQHLMRANSVSPEVLYTHLLALGGELSTFVRSATRRPLDYSPYVHEAPHTCFRPLVDDLRFLLNVVLERGAQRIALRDQAHGIHLAVVEPSHIPRYASFVLAVGAQMPADALQRAFSAQAKLGPSEQLPELLRLHLPGLPLHGLPVPPRQIPFNAGYVYFEIARDHVLWEQVAKHGGLAVHVAGALPELRMELWGILA